MLFRSVPDVDLQVLINGLKSGEVIRQLKYAVEQRILGNLGITDLLTSVNTITASVQNFNNVVTSRLNQAIIKRAVENYINYLVFNLLSGCSSTLLNTTLRPDVKSVLTPYAQYMQKIANGEINMDGSKPGTSTETL